MTDLTLCFCAGVLLTYYPLQSNFSVLSPQTGESYFSTALASLPAGKCMIQQELGYPSGYGIFYFRICFFLIVSNRFLNSFHVDLTQLD